LEASHSEGGEAVSRYERVKSYKVTKSPGIEALKAEVRPGRCIICDEPIRPSPSKGKPRYWLCGDADCGRTYRHIHGMDTRARGAA
jgi:hypothetical protein